MIKNGKMNFYLITSSKPFTHGQISWNVSVCCRVSNVEPNLTRKALHHLEIENIFCVIETRTKFGKNENLRTKANKIVNNVVSSKLLSPFHTTKLSLTNFTCQNYFSPYKLGIFDIEKTLKFLYLHGSQTLQLVQKMMFCTFVKIDNVFCSNCQV